MLGDLCSGAHEVGQSLELSQAPHVNTEARQLKSFNVLA